MGFTIISGSKVSVLPREITRFRVLCRFLNSFFDGLEYEPIETFCKVTDSSDPLIFFLTMS